jgi:type IV fimbrial biogenesis protein FimT
VLSRARLSSHPRRGFTLIELAITLAVVALVVALGAPSFAAWIQNTQIRNGGESTLAGIKLARAEALKRNSPVLFQLMTTADSSCAPSAAGPSWVVSVVDATSHCDVTDPATNPPLMIRAKPGSEGTANVAYAASQSSIGFNSLGQVTPAPQNGDIVILVTNPTGGDCYPTGAMRCQTIIVSPGGQARMCDPSVSAAGDPRLC